MRLHAPASVQSNLRVKATKASSPRAATSAMMVRAASSTSAAPSRLVARNDAKREAKSSALVSRWIGMAHASPSPACAGELGDGIANGTVIYHWVIRGLSNDLRRPD